MDKRSYGRIGETTAALYLEQNGYEILGRNVQAGHAEFDLLARTGETLVFVEVKTRRQYPGTPDRFGLPADAVDARKQAVLLRGVERYYADHDPPLSPRIDVIEVYTDPDSADYRVLEVRHYENAVRRTGKFSRTSKPYPYREP